MSVQILITVRIHQCGRWIIGVGMLVVALIVIRERRTIRIGGVTTTATRTIRTTIAVTIVIITDVRSITG